jgi:hypothetical protein
MAERQLHPGRSTRPDFKACKHASMKINTYHHIEMTPDERHRLEALWELAVMDEEDSNTVLEDINMQDILNGDEHLDISHAGGEFAALAAELNRDLRKA